MHNSMSSEVVEQELYYLYINLTTRFEIICFNTKQTEDAFDIFEKTRAIINLPTYLFNEQWPR